MMLENAGEFLMKKGIGSKHKMLTFMLSLLSVIGFKIGESLELLAGNGDIVSRYKEILGTFSLIDIFLFGGIYMFYFFVYNRLAEVRFSFRDRVYIFIPAFLFANFIIWGLSYEKTNSHDLVLGNIFVLLNSVLIFFSYFILFYSGIALIYTQADNLVLCSEWDEMNGGRFWIFYKKKFVRFPFAVPFLSMLTCYIPYIIISYPGILMGDSLSMIVQGYNCPEWTSDYLNLIDESVRLNGHHTIVYTELIHVCIDICRAIFGRANLGIFLVSMIQLLAILAVVSVILRYMIKRGVNLNIVLGIMLFYIISPRMQNYMFLISKDVLCGCALLLFVFCIYRITRERKNCSQMLWLGFAVSAIGVGLLRNEGRYIVLASMVIMLFLIKGIRKKILISGLAVITVVLVVFEVCMPVWHITPGSVREALSVPFQQTARYVQIYGDEVTAQEREAISAVLEYDQLAAKYDPNISNNVKAMFNEYAEKQELKAYFDTWWKMFLKHPGVYVQAMANNYYYYFYPGKMLAYFYEYDYSVECMRLINEDQNLRTLELDLHHPAIFAKVRNIYEVVREGIFALPVLNLLKCPAAYIWVLIVWLLYVIRNRGWSLLCFTAPLVFCLATALLGPCNGYYFRYIYGISVCLPVVIVLGLSEICDDRNKER